MDLKNDKNIVYNTYNINPKILLIDQTWELNEDLMQIELLKFGRKIIIDIGWYPSHDISGNLVAYIIENSDWENPLGRYNLDYLDFENELEKMVTVALKFIDAS